MPSAASTHPPVSVPEPVTRAALIQQYLPLVYQVAWQVKRRIGDHVTIEELVSAGTLGLMRAIDRYDPGRGRALSTYAVPRIRGAMLDELRERDWVPRRVRRRMREVSLAARKVEQREGRPARASDIANELAVPLRGYWHWIDESEGEVVPLQGSEPSPTSRTRELADRRQPSADDVVEARERSARLRAAIDALPPRMREVLTLTFYEELSGRAIAELTGVSESRVSQLKRVALQELGASLGDRSRL